MTIDATIIRFLISQFFAIIYLLLLIPFKEPKRKNIIIFVSFSILIVIFNIWVINYFGLPFYISYYFLTLLLPNVIALSFLALYKNAKLVFILLTSQVLANITIVNGLLTSYVIYGQNNPIADTVARALTYIIFFPLIYYYIRPTYIRMAKTLNKGWWLLNVTLIMTYAIAYTALFVPSPIFERPIYFIHTYLSISLSIVIYAVMVLLFRQVQTSSSIEKDKQLLFKQVSSLSEETKKMSSIAYKDNLTGIKNRFSLFKQMDFYIENKNDFYLLFMDLDNLKSINDSYNHIKGDAYIKAFAQTVEKVLGDSGDVYRYAGDEFVCIIKGDVSCFQKEEFKQHIEQNIDIDIPYLGVSLGLAIYPTHGETTNDLITYADQVMYKDKNHS